MNEQISKREKWKTRVLVGSLALNLLIIGLIAGMAFRGPSFDKNRKPPQDLLFHMVSAMPDEHRREVGREFRQARDKMRPKVTNLRELKASLADALTEPEFTIERVEVIFTQHARIVQDISQGGRIILLGQIKQMTAQDRQIFAEQLRKRIRKPRDYKK